MSERFSASVAGRHIACHASAHLELAIPAWTPPVVDEMAGAKGEGTRRHEMLEPIMALSPRAIDHFAKVLAYVAELRQRRRFKVLIEHTMIADWLDTKPQTTADLVLFTQDELHVVDFKWGKIPVELAGNPQLLFYALSYAPFAPKAKGAYLHLVQPECDTYAHWFADLAELDQFMTEARAAEAAILAGSTKFGPSDHCKFCPANPHSRGDKGRPLCPEMMQLLYPDFIDEDEILASL